MDDQLALAVADSPVPAHRIDVLAGVLAGFRWPARTSFDKLKKGQQEAARDAARLALERLAREEED